jgi:crossover junction endodeoxyribonuclease RuvC
MVRVRRTLLGDGSVIAVLGIDPGLSGALALYTGEDLIVGDVPTHELKRGGKAKREVDLHALAAMIRDCAAYQPTVWIEQVGAMPGQGVSSVFAFGKVYGTLLGICAANGLVIERVTPQVWKKAMGLQTAAKDAARARASTLLPAHVSKWARVKDDGRAEAALIALYGSAQAQRVAA